MMHVSKFIRSPVLLVAVGMFLAFLVALLQHGYYFEIMLPGSILGAIVGFATQRYKVDTRTA